MPMFASNDFFLGVVYDCFIWFKVKKNVCFMFLLVQRACLGKLIETTYWLFGRVRIL
ncbi:hypothetical protein Hanom_Chr06g00527361 [Helianthus anomalus]